ncbi:MAG: protein kinase, partial [Planctomycetota bacterium JB042]
MVPDTPDEGDREEELFCDARALSGTARDEFLRSACAGDEELRRRVLELLAADDAAGAFLREPDPLEGPGSVVGRYRLLERIGEGGGGEVFRAAPVAGDLPPVALKVVKPGTDTRQVLARFERERRALARMDHPGIARVLDAGATPSGRPFFVMELVPGEAITTYADARRLTLTERLALFREVCRAVQHAHQKGVIHRDLKPSNVLVAEVDGRAAPKVIDFGIAKAIEDEPDAPELTRHGWLVGTPQYMSPEQAGRDGLDVDVRADVYSLGVLLFELLTGSTPLDPDELRAAGLPGMARMVDAAVSPRPSRRLREHDRRAEVAALRRADAPRLARRLEDDLDWVVLKALERDREERYASVAELAEDVRRALDDEPVAAGPPSRWVRLRKLVRRNRLAVGAAAAVVVLLVAAVVGTSIGYLEATAARAELEESNARLSRLLAFQHGRLAAIDLPEMGTTLRSSLLEHLRPGLRGLGWSEAEVAERIELLDRSLAATNLTSVARDLTRTSLRDATEAAIEREFAGESVDRAALLHSLGLTMAALGFDAKALEVAERALALRSEAFGDSDPRTLDSVGLVAQQLRRLDRLDEAVPLQEAVVRHWHALYGAGDRHTLAARATLEIG